MHERKVIMMLIFFCASILLSTCQLQLNKASSSLTIKIVVPAGSGRSKSIPVLGTNGKDLSGGTSVTATISQGSTTYATSPSVAINGNTSVDISFVLPPPGMYQLSAKLLDGSGNTISQASTTFTVPTQINPVVLTMVSHDATSRLSARRHTPTTTQRTD
jgi:hypothetical protein